MPLREKHTFKTNAVHCVKYNSTGQYLLSAGRDKTIKLWNASGNVVKGFEGHGYEVVDIAVAHDNSQFASVGGDRAVFLWDVVSVDFNADASVIASGSFDATVRLWDCRSSSTKPIQILEEAKDSVSSVKIRDFAIYAASVDGKVRTYDLRQPALIVDDIGIAATSLSVTNDAACLLVSSMDSKLRLLDTQTGAMLRDYKGHKNNEFRVTSCFLFGEKCVASGSEDGKVFVWDMVTGNRLHLLVSHSNVVSSIASHPSRDQFVTAGVDGKIVIWEDW